MLGGVYSSKFYFSKVQMKNLLINGYEAFLDNLSQI